MQYVAISTNKFKKTKKQTNVRWLIIQVQGGDGISSQITLFLANPQTTATEFWLAIQEPSFSGPK